MRQFLELCPVHGRLLDAACGTGKYWPVILASGRSVFGTDQSQEMLKRAQAKHPGVPLATACLQAICFREVFDGAICIDAMEFVPPEDWLHVLGNFHRAIKLGGYFYFTVEMADRLEIEHDYDSGRQAGLPLVRGESVHEGGYHYFPPTGQVTEWVRMAGFYLVGDLSGDDYHHFLVQKR
jgi:SAM-dependent methyltransferase